MEKHLAIKAATECVLESIRAGLVTSDKGIARSSDRGEALADQITALHQKLTAYFEKVDPKA